MSGKYALIIGNTEYIDSGLAQLSAPGKDAEDFAQVLKDQEIGAFDSVNILLNQSSAAVTEAIDEFFDQKKQDDLLVLYFSGHGVRDELGALYLAVKNTIRSRLRSTAVKSDFIREAMDQCRSKRQVLILDCCNSGAFAQGTKAATGVSIGTATAFESGFGRIILTASDATQFAWEGDQVIGETDNSLFTHYLVEGLKGDADNDGDGRITVDELYDYANEKVRRATPKQTPSKFSTKQQGEIILRQNMRIEGIKSAPLPEDLIAATKNSLPSVREGAVRQLEDLLKGRNLGLARSAREALERIEKEDDSRRISLAAHQALEAINVEKMSEHQIARSRKDEIDRFATQKAEADKLAMEKAENERIARAKAESERKAKIETERLAAQKAESDRLAKQKLEDERLAQAKLEADRKAKEETDRLAAQKAEKVHGKYALIIANSEYTDPGLKQLTAPGKDAEDFAQVLKAPDFGGFDEVQTVINPDNATARRAIDKFFNQKKWNDLLVFYFSGHGVRDDDGSLYLAVKNTDRSLLDSTGIESVFIRRKMEKSLSKKQVLILDCCNSGAFASGTKGDDNMGTPTAFIKSDGSGQIILAASDKTQYAFEGDTVTGDPQNSVFTKYLIKGLKGEADYDRDGQITVTELYYYVSDHVKQETKSKQTPIISMNRQEGEIFLRQGLPIKTPLIGQDILVLVHSEDQDSRLFVITRLTKLLQDKDSEKVLSAQKLLEQLAKDNSNQVADAARRALKSSKKRNS